MRMILTALTVGALLSGCALIAQDRPGRHTASASCSTAPWWVGDIVLLAAETGVAIAGVGMGNDAGKTMTAAMPVTGVVTLSSLGNGVTWWGQCRRGMPAESASVARAE